MFLNCKALVSLDISNFKTSKVTTMHRLIAYCENLKELNLASYDTSKVVD